MLTDFAVTPPDQLQENIH